MSKNKYVFAWLIEFLDKNKFRHLADKFNGSGHSRTGPISCTT